MALPPTVEAPLHDIERHLAAVIASFALPDALRAAIEYAALGPGKRIRPLLTWHCAKTASALASNSDERATETRPAAHSPLAACAAVELIHAFSLVHDDLPALDNDDLRRGRPTLHRHTTEAMAVLAGDAMLTAAFAAMLLPVDGEAMPPSLAISLLAELSSSTMDMIAGQVHDTMGGLPPHLSPIEQVALIHRRKTGALIAAACRMGARCAGVSEGSLEPFARYGEAIGLMFQIVDDLLDVEQNASHTGKRTRKDHAAGKQTYPAVLGVEGARDEVRRLGMQAASLLAPFGEGARPLLELSEWLMRRTR
ncbi:MAG: polyprenyl synthetase family protein [Phycisphaeraceae bacterium]|nr:polyprenyl synthetase family protein [Phycisphaeraceae bacterium]